MIITGIGSRQTPEDVCELFTELGEDAKKRGWWIRSGHAEGADYAFEKGARENCIVYLPWQRFNVQLEIFGVPQIQTLRDDVLEIVYQFEPHAKELSDPIKLIKSRNVYQILGVNLDTPSDFVICWTEDGKVVGGTGLALKIAKANDIPVINVGDPGVRENLDDILQEIVRELV